PFSDADIDVRLPVVVLGQRLFICVLLVLVRAVARAARVLVAVVATDDLRPLRRAERLDRLDVHQDVSACERARADSISTVRRSSARMMRRQIVTAASHATM